MRNSKQNRKKAEPVPMGVIVRVDGRRWRRVLNLSASSPTDHHFLLKTEPNGSTTVQFGDGVHGASASKAMKVDVTLSGPRRRCPNRPAALSDSPHKGSGIMVRDP